MIDFPSAGLVIGQLFYASNGVTYRWNGTAWLSEPSLGTGYGPTGDFSANTQSGSIPLHNSQFTGIPVVAGNQGNWYVPATGRYIPPPGRYYICATFSGFYSAAIHLVVELRKNGIAVARGWDTAGAASWYTDPQAAGVFDANGSDVFEMWGGSVSAASTAYNISFYAFPISGAKGPPGDKGATGDLGNLAALHLHEISEVTSGAPAQLAVTIPLNAKKIEFDFYARCSTVVDANLCFQWMQGSTPLTANSYYGQYLYGSGSTPGTAPTGPATYWSIGGLMYWGGTMRAHLTADATGIPNWAETTIMGSATGGTRYAWHQMMYTGIPNAQITGIRMFYLGGQTFALGSFLKCFSIN